MLQSVEWQSFILVVISEMGDKTQLLALMLAARYRQPWTIMAGILIATLLNHALAAWLGAGLASLIQPHILRWLLALSFFGFAIWLLIPDKAEELKPQARMGALLTTIVAFFIAEMGDKTQLATIALGARFHEPLLVTIGTTAGMLVADGAAVFFGEALTRKLPIVWIHRFAALLFFGFGVAILVS